MFFSFSQSLPKPYYRQLWETYKGWISDTGSMYDNKIAGAKARMSASGSRVTDDEWGETIAGIEAERSKEIDSLKNTATYKALESNYNRYVRGYSIDRGDDYYTPEASAKRAEGRMERGNVSLEDYFGEQYGPMEVGGTQEPPAETSTTAIQEEEDRPGMTITADLYSPWMEKV